MADILKLQRDERKSRPVPAGFESFAPVIEWIVSEVVSRIRGELRESSSPRQQLCYTEAEAARMLDMKPRQLAYRRRLGQISCSRLGDKEGIRYTGEDIGNYLKRSRKEAKEQGK